LATKAVQLAPSDGNIRNTLGVAQYRGGNWGAAVEALQKSMDVRSGGDACDYFFMAMAHWQRDQKEEAAQWYEKGVAWMEKNKSEHEELKRFRAEAASLLGVAEKSEEEQDVKPTTRVPENTNTQDAEKKSAAKQGDAEKKT
jgi:hypothetical protein